MNFKLRLKGMVRSGSNDTADAKNHELEFTFEILMITKNKESPEDRAATILQALRNAELENYEWEVVGIEAYGQNQT